MESFKMDESINYIKPKIGIYNSFDDAFNSSAAIFGFEDEKEDWEYKLFFSHHRTLVLAEPGFGKTELLNQIVSEGKNHGKKTVFIDCKKIFVCKISSYVSERTEAKDIDENVIVCFDALDEIRYDDFSNTINEIKTFLADNPKATAIISCRKHFYEKHSGVFDESDFQFIRIFPFSFEQIKQFLRKNSDSHISIDKIMDTLSIRRSDTIVQVPRYLGLFSDYIKEKQIEEIESMTKAELFEYFIYSKLKIEGKKLKGIEKDYFKEVYKNVLEKLALIMEIYQTNILKKEELITFFDEIKSNLILTMQDRITLGMFLNKSVLKSSEDIIEFENTEFQEYLAAKEISRLGKNKRIIFELAIEPEIKEIKPSWFNTLQFLIDINISLLKPLIEFNKNSPNRITEDEDYHRLLTNVNVTRLNTTEREAIFCQIFNYYQNSGRWIDWIIARNLSYYYVNSHGKYIKESYDEAMKETDDERKQVQLSNISTVVDFIQELDGFDTTTSDFWKNKLIEFANKCPEYQVLSRIAVSSLSSFNDDSVIGKIKNVWLKGDKLAKDSFLTFCKEVNPNHPESINHFIKGILSNSIYARYGIWSISEKNSIKKLLTEFNANNDFLYGFLDRESIFDDGDNQIVENIGNVYDDEIGNLLHGLIIKAYKSKMDSYKAEHSKFLPNIAKLLKEKNKEYLFKLIDDIEEDDFFHLTFYMSDVFANLIEINQVKKFINSFSDKNNAFSMLNAIKGKNIENAQKIYEEGRKYIPEIYNEYEKSINHQSKKYDSRIDVYAEFKKKLSPVPVNLVFDFYLKNKEYLDTKIKDEEKNKLKKLVKDTVLDKFDPGKQELTIREKREGSISYTTHSWIRIYPDCLRIASHLGINLSKYRKNIINFIPFAMDSDLDFIFKVVPHITQTEIKSLLKVYKEKNDDLWRFHPESLINAAETYNLREAAPILRDFVKEKEFDIYVREKALKIADFLNSDPDFLKSIFKFYSKSKDNGIKRLAIIANSILIENHEDKDAISWRFDQLVKRAFPFEDDYNYEGVRSISPEESELRNQEFANPLLKLKKPEFEDKFLNLLKKSFDIYKKPNHKRYATYLWEIVCAYFDNRKEEKSYKPLQKLESAVSELSNEAGMNWFGYKLAELKKSYLSYVGKPNSIAECIKKYNQLKEQQYLDISTSYDLKEKIIEILDTDLRRWIEGEGAYSFIVDERIRKQRRQNYEDFIQKTIKTQIENALLKRGFKEYDIIREPQLLSNKRVDFIISYGLAGTVLLELKLTTNDDIGPRTNLEKQDSFESMDIYMKGYKADVYGIFCVVDNKRRNSRSIQWDEHLKRIKIAYKKIPNVEVFGLSCLKPSKIKPKSVKSQKMKSRKKSHYKKN